MGKSRRWSFGIAMFYRVVEEALQASAQTIIIRQVVSDDH
jgi:hypothetical protein